MAGITPIQRPGAQRPRGRASGKVVKEESTIPVNFRADAREIRQLDEMVAGRYDPAWKTRSDVLDAAVEAINAEHFQKFLAQGHRDTLLYEMYRIRKMREVRKEELIALSEEIDHHQEFGNVAALRRLFIDAFQFLNDLNQDEYGDNGQKETIDRLVKKLKGYIAAWDSNL
jgi:hypothetical protein